MSHVVVRYCDYSLVLTWSFIWGARRGFQRLVVDMWVLGCHVGRRGGNCVVGSLFASWLRNMYI